MRWINLFRDTRIGSLGNAIELFPTILAQKHDLSVTLNIL
jgi:hypothetical protein